MPPCFDNAETVTFVDHPRSSLPLTEPVVRRIRPREKLIALLGRTDTGKTSTFNLLTGLSQPVGNRICSTTSHCFSHGNVIDTPGFGDTRGGDSSHLSLVDFFISLSSGIDLLLYFVRYGAMNTHDLDLFVDIYQRVLSPDAYANSCLVITDYALANLEQVNVEHSDERQSLLKQLYANEKYAYVLKKFDDRVIFIDVSPHDLNRRMVSKRVLDLLLASFRPTSRFNCQNLQDAYRLLRRTQEMESLCSDYQQQLDRLTTENHHLTHLYGEQIRHCNDLDDAHQRAVAQLEQVHQQTLLSVETNHFLTIEEMKRLELRLRDEVKQVRQQLAEIERDMERSITFNVASYIPLIHIVTNIIELNSKRKITQRIRKLLQSKKNKTM